MASTYSTWEYYSGTYRGRLAEEQYRNNAKKAKLEIDHQTFGRAVSAPASMDERLCDCECALVDAMQSYTDAQGMLPMGISAVNNDGFSVSAGDGRERSQNGALRAVCLRYLCRPRNLMYRGVK